MKEDLRGNETAPVFEKLESDFLINCHKHQIIRFDQPTMLRDGRISPYYVNLRDPMTGLNPELTISLAKLMAKKVVATSRMSDKKQVLIGIPDASTTLAAITGYEATINGQDVPFLTMRKIPKAYGVDSLRDKLIIGQPQESCEYNLVDDVITTSLSKVEAIEICKTEGFDVRRVFVWFDLQQGGQERLIAQTGVELHAVFKILEVFDFYLSEGLLPIDQYRELVNWIKSQRSNQNLT